MIQLIEQVIREHPVWLTSLSDFSLAKMSTPNSGSGRDQGLGKVILFVFEKGKKKPTLCLKTVRTYSAKSVIERGYGNLQLLNQSISSSPELKIFAQPLLIFDNGEGVFSIETVCPGHKPSTLAELELAINKYLAWQARLAVLAEKFWEVEELSTLLRSLINELDFLTNKKDLIEYSQKFWLDGGSNFRLPKIIQHGDLTVDNILIDKTDVSLVDYDYSSIEFLPGFDLFNLLSKTRGNKFFGSLLNNHYWRRYWLAIGVNEQSNGGIFFIHYLQELRRKKDTQEKISAEVVISNFQKILKIL